MKTIILGDIHGRPIWENIINQEKNFDRLIFVGDYFDSKQYTAAQQIDNFAKIIEYKNTHSEKEIVLLVGNHDLHYFPEIGNTGTSGYQPLAKYDIEEIIQANRKHLQVAYRWSRFLVSHAGISSEFMNITFGSGKWNNTTVVDDLNTAFIKNPFLFKFFGTEPSGDDPEQTPLWIRTPSLVQSNIGSPLAQYTQIFGHTMIADINEVATITKGKYYLIDCLGTSKEYLVVEDGIIKTKKHTEIIV